jgi:hypothetical protein
MELVAAMMILVLKMKAAVYGLKLSQYCTALRCPRIISHIVGLLNRIQCSVPQPELQDSQIPVGHWTMETIPADVCFTESTGYHMTLMPPI